MTRQVNDQEHDKSLNREVLVLGPELPSIREQLETGTDLEARIDVAEKYIGKENEARPLQMTERAVLSDFIDFLDQVRQAAAQDVPRPDPRVTHQVSRDTALAAADLFERRSTFLSTDLRNEAIAGLAARHIEALRTNTDAQVIFWHPEHNGGSSQQVITAEIMEHILRTAPELAPRILMTSDLSGADSMQRMKSTDPENLSIALADDWIISGAQSNSDVIAVVTALDKAGLLASYGHCIEVERLVGRDDQIKGSFGKFDSEIDYIREELQWPYNGPLPPRVVVYFRTPAPEVLDGVVMPLPTGSQTCPDYGFDLPVSTLLIQYLLNQAYLNPNTRYTKRMPYILTVRRPGRNAENGEYTTGTTDQHAVAQKVGKVVRWLLRSM